MARGDALGLTAKQRAVLAACRQHFEANGFPPTRRELATALGYRSVGSVQFHLDALARRGLISRDPQRPRALSWSREEDGEEPTRVSADSFEVSESNAITDVNRVPVLSPLGETLRWLALPAPLAGPGAVAVHNDDPCPSASLLHGDLLVLNQREPCTSELVALAHGTRVRVVTWSHEPREGSGDEVLGVVESVIRRV